MNLDNGLTIPPRNPDVLEATVLGILRTYNAQMWLPGPSGVTGNYEDSLGSIPLTAVNGIVGYVGDESSAEQAENICLNSEFSGADAVTPPPGSFGWGTSNGITLSYLGTGVDSIGRYIDARISGTALATTYPSVSFAPQTSFACGENEVVSGAVFQQMIAGDLTGVTLGTLRLQCLTSGAVYVNEAVGPNVSASLVFAVASRVTPATTAYVRAGWQWNVTFGATVDCTVRLWQPRGMRGRLAAYAPTTGTGIYRANAYIPLLSPTTANKPTLYGGLLNYCLNSYNMPLWGRTRLDYLGEVSYPNVGTAHRFAENSGVAAAHYMQSSSAGALPANTVCFYSVLVRYVSGPSTRIRVQSRENDGATFPLANVDLANNVLLNLSNGGLSVTCENAADGFKKITMTWDSGPGSSTCIPYVMTDGGTANDGSNPNVIDVTQAMVGVGTSYSGPVPVVGNSGNPQSASIVPYSWKFDGTADRLQIAKINVDPGSDHFVICAFKMPPATISAARAPVGYGNAGAQERLQIIFLSNNVINCFWRDAAGVAVSILSGQPARAVNEKLCITMRRKTGNFYGSVKGSITPAASGTTAVLGAAWVPTLGFVGGSASTGTFTFQWEDEIYGVITGNGAPTDAELLVMENFLIGCAGFTPVP